MKQRKIQEIIDSIDYTTIPDTRITNDKDVFTLTKENSYRGEERLKKAGIKHYLTKDMIIEYIKCKYDPIYFIKSYVKIRMLDHSTPQYIHERMFDYQEDMIEKMTNNRFIIVLASRQMSKTTTSMMVMLWYLTFNPNYKIEIVSYKREDAEKALAELKMMYENLPFWLQQGVETWNIRSIKLGNGANVSAKSSTGSRGGSLNMLYIDELAFVPNGEELFASSYPTLESGKTTKMIITSTPRGREFFYELWTKAIRGQNKFIPIKILYHQHPDRAHTSFKIDKIKEVGYKIFRQEYEVEFLGSSETLISGNKLQEIEKDIKKPLAENANGKSSVRMYASPLLDRDYILCADVSEGIGGDYSTIIVIDPTEIPFQVVYVYRSNYISPHQLANLIFKVGTQYNEALAIIENNNYGHTTNNTLSLLDYPNIISTRSGLTTNKGKMAHGVRMTSATKGVGCTIFKGIVETGIIKLNDVDIINEVTVFERNGDSYGAITGHHDDLVMALINFSVACITPRVRDLLPFDDIQVAIADRIKVDEVIESIDEIIENVDGVTDITLEDISCLDIEEPVGTMAGYNNSNSIDGNDFNNLFG